MSKITTENTIKELRKIFSTFGLPKTLVSDNDPQLVGNDFETFCKLNGINHVTTPPYNPAHTGLF